MEWAHVIWDPLPGGNVEHVEGHDLTTDDVEGFSAEAGQEAQIRAAGNRGPCVASAGADMVCAGSGGRHP